MILTCLILGGGCKQSSVDPVKPEDITEVLKSMTSIMVHDVTNPPLASRFFSYASLAGYEVVTQNDTTFKSMYGGLKDYPLIKKPAIANISYKLAALLAMLKTAEKLQPSGQRLDSVEQALRARTMADGLSEDIVNASGRYADYIANAVLKYAKEDGYRKISDLPRYTPKEGAGYWYPTPPAYMAAVEPQFKTVRTFYLDSCSQFKPDPPTQFDSTKGSEFYKLMDAVYLEGKSLPEEHRQIASFWDCNPFAVQNDGHLQIGIKKISPGAHWMSIAGIACKKTNASFGKTMQVYAVLSTTLLDAFVSCWDEKYRSNRIRPETVIRKYIDPEWQPLLQTPPFPEYVSGHSIASTAAAQVLSHFFGPRFSFSDDTETDYGLPIRNFTSFEQAASEAAISRFYGGIHFMDAIVNGQRSGVDIGNFVLRKISQ
jgi:hypothetical protein